MAQIKAFALVLLAAATLAMAASTAAAQSSPQDFLDAHNAARRGEGVGLPDVAWSTTLQAFAESYVAQLAATTCSLAHSNSEDLGYGENLYGPAAAGSSAATAAAAVGKWMEEKADYVYSSNTCTRGALLDCGHYTQIVWRSTTSIGCASAACSNGGGVIVSCNYSPPGNWPDQRPY
ncbi:pathogenesis-related protein PRB1-2-like [Oryza glaberrima]|uniref:SCP domain-containing protein n=1 Tax=Oryza glaberrima TaxID=4538 RepID=I1Q7S9_ORYGL|nr:pathogenesis-related protein PRB1-2-like [Oryza glaberrima]